MVKYLHLRFAYMNRIDMPEQLEEMSAFFNARAEKYNTVHLGHVGGMESKNIIASFLPGHTQSIIDFGIGTGLELDGIFARFPNAEVTGLDIAGDMLRILKDSYPDRHINLMCESYLVHDFGVCRYDAAVSVMTFHHYDYETKVILYRRIYDCIKDNGVYIECDYMISEPEPGHGSAQETEDFYFSEYARLKAEQGIADDKEYHYDTPCTVENQIKMLTDAGFSDVRKVWRKPGGSAVVLVAEKSCLKRNETGLRTV